MGQDLHAIANRPIQLAAQVASVQKAIEVCVGNADVRNLPIYGKIPELFSPAASAMSEAVGLIRRHALPKAPFPLPGESASDFRAALSKLENAVRALDDSLRNAADKIMALPYTAGEVHEALRTDQLSNCRPVADALEEARDRLTGLAFVPFAWLKTEHDAAKGVRTRRDKELKQRKAERRLASDKSWARRVAGQSSATPARRTGTRLIAEKFLPGAQVYECESCGAGMSERVRRGGKHILVCGYCSAERELAAPPKGKVVGHDLLATLRDKRELLLPVAGLNAWSCLECGAEVECAAEKMTDRCGYCGSHNFAPVSGEGQALQPQGVLRFACTPERATQMLRDWLKQRPDAPAGLADEVEVETVQARYLPYWILNVTVPDSASARPLAAINNFHCCASRQVLHRMPAELRGIEPFETRQVPPFDSSQLAGVVTERFTIDLDHAWERAKVVARAAAEAGIRKALVELSSGTIMEPSNRQIVTEAGLAQRVEAGLSLAEPTFRYLLLPVFFFVLEWRGRELHALVDGAGTGVGMDYPRSSARILERRLLRIAAGAAALGALVAVGLLMFFGSIKREIAERRIQSEADASLAQEVVKINESTRRKKAQEAAELERKRNPPPDPKVWREVATTPLAARTWESPPLRLVCGFEGISNVKPGGEMTVDATVVVYLRDRDSRCPLYLRKFNDQGLDWPAVLASDLHGAGKISLVGQITLDRFTAERARKSMLAAAGLDEGGTYSAIERIELVPAGGTVVPAFDGTVLIEFQAATPSWFRHGTLRVSMPTADVPAFCRLAANMSLDKFLCDRLVTSGDLRFRPEENEQGLDVAQKAVNDFLKAKSTYSEWAVTVDELLLDND